MVRVSESTSDGRVARGERNRERIVSALVELIREGRLVPTAEQVAERAGVGTRTVFRHFDDMEGLHAQIFARIEQEVRPLFEQPWSGGLLSARVSEFVERRVALYERIAPFRRSGNVTRWRSSFLTDRHARMVRKLRRGLLEALPELRSAPEPLLEAFDLATSFEAWDRLRGEQRLGGERTRATILAAAVALVAALPS